MIDQRIFVALDLETTGLDPKTDEIIEIGAVRFQGDQILNRFSTLINPGRVIPHQIQRLTNISTEEAASAPRLQEVMPELLAFIDREVFAVVAHNAGFDLSFLNAAGIRLNRQAFDTFELATILWPSRPSYSLSRLCLHEGISLVDAHRALDDSEATARLFYRLWSALLQLPISTVETIVQCGTFTPHQPLFPLAEYEKTVQQDQKTWPLLPLFQEVCAARKPGGIGSPNGLQLHGWANADAKHHADMSRSSAPDNRPAVPPTLSFAKQDSNETDGVGEPGLERPQLTPELLHQIIDQIFATDGLLARELGNLHEWRAEQLDMAVQVLNSLLESDNLIIEAGAGTGKSLAYLISASLWSLYSGQVVVIATNTLALQDQLIEKDIPLVQRLITTALGNLLATDVGKLPRTEVLKGRSNYLCTHRLKKWIANRRLSPLEMRVLARILVWLPATKSGDVAELFLPSQKEREIWSQLCSDPIHCSGHHPHSRSTGYQAFEIRSIINSGTDYCDSARERSEVANLLIVNHSLLVHDAAVGVAILPPYRHVIIDEGHRLDEVATQQFTYRANCQEISTVCHDLLAETRQMVRFYRTSRDAPPERAIHCLQALAQHLDTAIPALDRFANSIRSFFGTVMRDSANDRANVHRSRYVHLDSSACEHPAWDRVEMEWARTNRKLRATLQEGVLLKTELVQAQRQPAAHASLLPKLDRALKLVDEFASRLNSIVFVHDVESRSAHPVAAWLEKNGQEAGISIQIAPLRVNRTLAEMFVKRKASVVVTGATLSTGDGFEYIRNQLGLWDASATVVGGPVSQANNTLLLMPSDLPDPSHQGYQLAIERAIIAAARATDGKTLVLFTNRSQLKTCAAALREQLAAADIQVLEQSSASRRRLLQEFRAADRAVLLGNRTFWEGIDLPGEELSTLVIVKLPFAVPTDPVVAARSATYENPFMDFMVPDAILRFRQGFGRLIRRRGDRGTVLLLDSRIWQKSYGQLFLDSLPNCTQKRPTIAEIDAEISYWMANEPVAPT